MPFLLAITTIINRKIWLFHAETAILIWSIATRPPNLASDTDGLYIEETSGILEDDR